MCVNGTESAATLLIVVLSEDGDERGWCDDECDAVEASNDDDTAWGVSGKCEFARVCALTAGGGSGGLPDWDCFPAADEDGDNSNKSVVGCACAENDEGDASVSTALVAVTCVAASCSINRSRLAEGMSWLAVMLSWAGFNGLGDPDWADNTG